MDEDPAMLALMEWAERLLDEMDEDKPTTLIADDGQEITE